MNSYCVICHERIVSKIGWSDIFSQEMPSIICETCQEKFEMLSGELCEKCSRPLEAPFQNGKLCLDCFRWEEDIEWKGLLDKNESLFRYNDFMKEVMARFKFRGDYILIHVFQELVKIKLRSFNADLFIPIPLSNERLYERGFNQAEAIIVHSGRIPSTLLLRHHSEKQSKKTRLERIKFSQVFQTHAEINLEGKKIVLVDDIYTTGSTLRHAAKLLKENGAAKVYSVTLAR